MSPEYMYIIRKATLNREDVYCIWQTHSYVKMNVETWVYIKALDTFINLTPQNIHKDKAVYDWQYLHLSTRNVWNKQEETLIKASLIEPNHKEPQQTNLYLTLQRPTQSLKMFPSLWISLMLLYDPKQKLKLNDHATAKLSREQWL